MQSDPVMEEKSAHWLLDPNAVDPSRPRRGKARALLVAATVTVAAVATRCGPFVTANPKGCRFDDAGVQRCDGDPGPDPGTTPDAGRPD